MPFLLEKPRRPTRSCMSSGVKLASHSCLYEWSRPHGQSRNRAPGIHQKYNNLFSALLRRKTPKNVVGMVLDQSGKPAEQLTYGEFRANSPEKRLPFQRVHLQFHRVPTVSRVRLRKLLILKPWKIKKVSHFWNVSLFLRLSRRQNDVCC